MTSPLASTRQYFNCGLMDGDNGQSRQITSGRAVYDANSSTLTANLGWQCNDKDSNHPSVPSCSLACFMLTLRSITFTA